MSDKANGFGKKAIVIGSIIAVVAMLGWKLTEGWRDARSEEQLLLLTSDLGRFGQKVEIWGDGWLGYMLFRSREFQRRLEDEHIGVAFKDEPDFQARYAALASGDCDIALGTVDSYLLHGSKLNYPGVIIFMIDESAGGDAIVAKKTIQSIDQLNSADISGAFVGESPSEFLLKSQIAHFQLEQLLPKVTSFRVDDAKVAFDQFQSGSADFAVLWEPYTTLALNSGDAHRLIDSSQARGVILDIAIASRKLVAENPELVQTVVQTYFDTLGTLGSDSEKMLALAMADSQENRETTQAMLRGVAFQSIAQNAQLSGLGHVGGPDFIQLISGVRQILVEVGDLPAAPNAGGLSVLTNRQFIEGASKGASPAALTPTLATHVFRPLSDGEWTRLDQQLLGTLIDRPITFPSGQARIPDEFRPNLNDAAAKLTHYPTYRVIVHAHVSEGSDPAADLMLSQERADAIRDYLVSEANVAGNRIRAVGMGAAELLEKRDGESLAAWKRRCRRAKIFIAEDS